MAGKAFADTNIILRLLNEALPEHHEVKKLVDQIRADGYELWISRQVVREYLVQVTRPGFLDSIIPAKQVLTQIETLRTLFRIADETEAVTDQLLELIQDIPTGGKQIHDANIVATMLVYNLDILITINIADMKRFDRKVTVVSPSTVK